jgi:hypothetical protein
MGISENILNNLKKKFIEGNNIKSAVAEEKLYSKKNSVYKIRISFGSNRESSGASSGRYYILKEFEGEDKGYRFEKELFFYRHISGSSGLNLPCIYYEGDTFLIIEFLGEKTLLDYIIEKEKDGHETGGGTNDDASSGVNKPVFEIDYRPIADSLRYIIDFNNYFKDNFLKPYILSDMNLRNFISTGGKTYRIDFEDCREGHVEEDAGKFIAFFLTYKPEFTSWKQDKAKLMQIYCVENLGMNEARLKEEVEKELQAMKKRRI